MSLDLSLRRSFEAGPALLACLVAMTLALALGVVPAIAQQEGSAGQQGESSLKDLVRSAGASVVLLKIYDYRGKAVGSGTGFYVGPNVIATNHHVIENARRVGAVLRDGSEVPVEAVLAEDSSSDLALVKVPAGPPPLPLYSGLIEAGENVAVIGSPQGLAETLSTGIVSAVRENGLEDDGLPGPLIQISAPISRGSSGSPVMNLRGEVIAVAVAVIQSGQNLNFAVPVQKLVELERSIDPSGKPVRVLKSGATGSMMGVGRNVLISVAIFAALIFVLRRLR